MKRQSIRIFIFISLITIVEYNVAQIEQTEMSTVTLVEAPAITPRAITTAEPPTLPVKPVGVSVPAEKKAIVPTPVIPPSFAPPALTTEETKTLPEKPAGSPAASRLPTRITRTEDLSAAAVSAREKTLPEKPAGSPAAARPKELAAPEMKIPAVISAKPQTLPQKPLEALVEAQKTAAPPAPGLPARGIAPEIRPAEKIAEPAAITGAVKTPVEAIEIPAPPAPLEIPVVQPSVEEEIPATITTLEQQAIPRTITPPDSRVPFELQEIEDLEEVPEDEQPPKAPVTITKEVTDQATQEAEEERIEFQFENTDLKNVIDQISQLFNVTFITDDIINPMGPGGKSVKEYKLSFRTNKPLTPTDAWNLFTSFLDIAGFALVDSGPNTYRVINADKAPTAALPSYIGTDPSTLPDSDQIIRYVYFIENTNITSLQQVIERIKSPTGILLSLLDLKALLFIDKSYNIKMMLKIVKELDKVNMPQAMAVLKLRRAEASDVEKLFKSIMSVDETRTPFYPGPRKPSTALYFPEGTRVIAEPRTNSLIVLGTPEAIEKIEAFVKKNIDKEPDRPYSPLFHYDLKYADAKTIAAILTDLIKFGEGSPEAIAKMGGIRGGDRYFKPMKFIPDTTTNRLIIRGDYQDYLAFKEIIDQLDKPQQQIAIEILILTVTLNDERALGAALRKKEPSGWDSAIGTRATFQTTGFAGQGAVLRDPPTPGGQQLLGNLINLVQGLTAGNSILSLGFDAYGVWGVLRALEAISTAHVVANPFLVASNKQKATVSVGEIKRLIAATVTSAGDPQNSFGDVPATLTVALTPQINSDGKIVLSLNISIEDFVPGATPTTAAKNTKAVTTTAIVSDREVLALGGLIQNRITDGLTKVPILGDVPILGWLFKNQNKLAAKQNLLILISAQIIDPEVEGSAQRFSQNRIDDYQGMLQGMQEASQKRDPIHKWFFDAGEKSVERRVENFIFKKPAKRKERAKEQKELLSQATPTPAKASGETVVADVTEQIPNPSSQLSMSDLKQQIFGPTTASFKQQTATATPRRHRHNRKHVSLMQAEGNSSEVGA